MVLLLTEYTPFPTPKTCHYNVLRYPGSHLPHLQRLQGRRAATRAQPCDGMGRTRHPRQHHFSRLYHDGHGKAAIHAIPGAQDGVAAAEHVGEAEQAGGVSRGGGVFNLRGELVHDGERFEDGWGA